MREEKLGSPINPNQHRIRNNCLKFLFIVPLGFLFWIKTAVDRDGCAVAKGSFLRLFLQLLIPLFSSSAIGVGMNHALPLGDKGRDLGVFIAFFCLTIGSTAWLTKKGIDSWAENPNTVIPNYNTFSFSAREELTDSDIALNKKDEIFLASQNSNFCVAAKAVFQELTNSHEFDPRSLLIEEKLESGAKTPVENGPEEHSDDETEAELNEKNSYQL